MHGDALRWAEIDVRLDGVGRVHVLCAHEPARLIGADRQQRDVRRAEPASDLGEMRPIAGIPCEIDAAGGALQEMPAP